MEYPVTCRHVSGCAGVPNQPSVSSASRIPRRRGGVMMTASRTTRATAVVSQSLIVKLCRWILQSATTEKNLFERGGLFVPTRGFVLKWSSLRFGEFRFDGADKAEAVSDVEVLCKLAEPGDRRRNGGRLDGKALIGFDRIEALSKVVDVMRNDDDIRMLEVRRYFVVGACSETA